jgi:protein SCO1/2
MRLSAAALLAAALLGQPAFAHTKVSAPVRSETLDQDQALRVSQEALGRALGNHRFVDSKGRTVQLDELRGRPLVVSLIYTSCSHICPMITQRVRAAVDEARRVIGGERFNVITVGFDTRNDTPMRMAAFARAQGADAPNWLFLSGEDKTVAALAADLGFTYAASAGGYQHVSQTTIVDSNGRVYRQVYGDDFPIQVFMEPLKEAVYGTVGNLFSASSLIDRVRFLCTVYDPNQGRYRISYTIVMSLLAGVISLGATALVLSRAWLNARQV